MSSIKNALSPMLGRPSGQSTSEQQFQKWKKTQNRHFKAFVSSTSSDKRYKAHAWAHRMIELEIYLCEVVQQESSILTACDGVEKEIPKDTQIKLESLDKEYLKTTIKIYENDFKVPKGPLEKAYRSRKQNPVWSNSGFLRQDCISRRGCCSRECGCCQRSRPASTRKEGQGHCTKACGCCQETRGFALDNELRKLVQPTFDLHFSTPDPYSLDLFIAYTTGDVDSRCRVAWSSACS